MNVEFDCMVTYNVKIEYSIFLKIWILFDIFQNACFLDFSSNFDLDNR